MYLYPSSCSFSSSTITMASPASIQSILSKLSFRTRTTTCTHIHTGRRLQRAARRQQGAAIECNAQRYDHNRYTLPDSQSILPSLDGKDDNFHINHAETLSTVRSMLFLEEDPLKTLLIVDSLQRFGIYYHFKEEIRVILEKLYHNFYCEGNVTGNLFEVALLFRLLRQGGFAITPDVFNMFVDDQGRFESYLSKDIQGMLSLFEASQLNMGEDLLYRADEFSSKHLQSSMRYLEPNLASLVSHELEHPYHMSLQRYKARYFLSCQKASGWKAFLQETARVDFNIVQSLHQDEVKKATSWWKNLGLSKELTFVRDQPVKWYLWPMASLPDPELSIQRIELTKVISLIYLIDDIFDVRGSLEDLIIFEVAIKRWELSAANQLPSYMRICYKALYIIINDIANNVFNKTGWNPINSLKKRWTTLCSAFLKEAKWFRSKHLPTTEDYIRNGIISSGVLVVLVHAYFLVGKGITKENVDLLENNSALITNPAKLLKLWDDLGSAKDENQEGFDGSYIDCYTQENPSCSIQGARDHVMKLITYTWEGLNKESLSPSSFPSVFVETTMNFARMVKVMYSYDESKCLRTLEEYVNALLFKSI